MVRPREWGSKLSSHRSSPLRQGTVTATTVRHYFDGLLLPASGKNMDRIARGVDVPIGQIERFVRESPGDPTCVDSSSKPHGCTSTPAPTATWPRSSTASWTSEASFPAKPSSASPSHSCAPRGRSSGRTDPSQNRPARGEPCRDPATNRRAEKSRAGRPRPQRSRSPLAGTLLAEGRRGLGGCHLWHLNVADCNGCGPGPNAKPAHGS